MNRKLLPFATTVLLASNMGLAQAPATPQSSPSERPQRGTGVEMIARFTDQPTEIARTPDGRIFAVLYSAIKDKARLVEVKKDGSNVPYPNEQWNAGRQADGSGFSEIVALKAGKNGWLGVIDAGTASYAPRVIIFDTSNNQIVKVKELAAKRQPGAQKFKQDLAIDVLHRCIYAVGMSSDRQSATVIVFDLNQDAMRTFTVLKGKKIDSAAVAASGTTEKETASLRAGMNIPIAIDPTGEWLYLGGIGGDDIFRVPTTLLADPELDTDTLLKKVEKYGNKNICTHMVADASGNVYCAEDTRNIIGVFSPDRKYRTFLQDTILNYPYDLALGKDGYLYVSVNQLRRLNEKGNTTVDANHPFLIVRVKALQ